MLCYEKCYYIALIKIKHNFFKNTFFPSAIIEWNKLEPNLSIRTLEALLFLKAISPDLLDAPQKLFQLLQSQRN